MALYKVRGGFYCLWQGTIYPAGATLELTDEQTKGLMHMIEPVPADKPKAKKEPTNARPETPTES